MKTFRCTMTLMVVMVLFGCLSYYDVSLSKTSKEHPLTMERFKEQWRIIVDAYIKPLSDTSEARRACFQKLLVSGLSSCLNDHHARYLTKKDFDEMLIMIQGSFGGIGLVLLEKEVPATIVGIIEDSPAEESGQFQIGDRVIQINGEDVSKISYDAVITKIRGNVDTNVTIRVERSGTKRNPITLVRKEIIAQSIKVKDIDDQITYVRIYGFNERTPGQFFYHVGMRLISILPNGEQYLNPYAKKFIWDLRENPGGLMDSVALMGYFFSADPHQTILTIQSRKEEKVVRINNLMVDTSAIPPGAFRNVSGVMLINEKSASASEIFAAFMHEAAKTPLVGKKTYGKGSVQRIFILSHGDALVFTIAEYFVGNQRMRIEENGISPDFEIKSAAIDPSHDAAIIELVDPQKDPQLEKAIQILRER